MTDLAHYRSRSFWMRGLEGESEAPLDGDQRADVVIVGGGFTGLSAAYHLKRDQPDLDVALIESEQIGYGASGRNAGFAMTLFGLDFGLTSLRFGRSNALAAHRFMERAVDYVGELVREHAIDCDYERTGLLVVATTPSQERRLRKEVERFATLGVDDIEYLDAAETRARVDSPFYRGAKYEARCALVNPARLAWGLKRVCLELGVRIFEQTPATELGWKGGVRVQTPAGSLSADKLVLATNAFDLPGRVLRRKQIPVYTYIVLTEPLTDEQLAAIGWRGREGIEDARNLVHYYRLTSDSRLLMGGGDVRYHFGSRVRPEQDQASPVFERLETFLRTLFPSLADVPIAERWGGPVSVPIEMVPTIGTLGRSKQVVFSLGAVGHGVAFTQLAGQVVKDLILEQEGEHTDLFFVNRFTMPLPPEPLRVAIAQSIAGGMRLHDRFTERKVFGRRAQPMGALDYSAGSKLSETELTQ